MSNRQPLTALILALTLALVYFVAFPEDLSTLSSTAERILGVTQAVSPWLYVLVGFAILSRTVVRIWGSKPQAPEVRETRPT